VYINAVVSDAYVPGTTIPIAFGSHPDLISLTYNDPQLRQILRHYFNIQDPVFDFLQGKGQPFTACFGELTLPSQSNPGDMIVGCSNWGLSTTTSNFWFATELFLTHPPNAYVAYGPAGVWKEVPEPATISLLGFAVLAASMFGARRRQHPPAGLMCA
jgi:hypothetical protein